MKTGFLPIDKPGGITSHDVVARVRRATGVKKVGHAGTLDPMATGMLVVAVGSATRLIRYIQDGDKEYVADIRFGVATDTLDADGEVTESSPMTLTAEMLESALEGFRGETMQAPPMVSAVKQQGRRLYDLAREGIEVERSLRPITVHELSLLAFEAGEYPTSTIRVVCGKGTYVRVLADDIARALGGRAHLTSLRRTRVGSFLVAESLGIEELDRWEEVLVEPAEALSGLPKVRVDEEEAAAICHGRTLSEPPEISVGSELVVCDLHGKLLAVHRRDERGIRPEVVMGS